MKKAILKERDEKQKEAEEIENLKKKITVLDLTLSEKEGHTALLSKDKEKAEKDLLKLKDQIRQYSGGTKEYFFAEVQTTQITYPNGQKQIKFINGQEEIHFPDGSKEIRFEDKTIKYVFPNGHEKIVFPDGTVQQTFQSSNLQVQ